TVGWVNGEVGNLRGHINSLNGRLDSLSGRLSATEGNITNFRRDLERKLSDLQREQRGQLDVVRQNEAEYKATIEGHQREIRELTVANGTLSGTIRTLSEDHERIVDHFAQTSNTYKKVVYILL